MNLIQRAEQRRLDVVRILSQKLAQFPGAELQLVALILDFIPRMTLEVKESLLDKIFDMQLIDSFKVTFLEEFEHQILRTPAHGGEWLDKMEQELIWSPFPEELDSQISATYTHWKKFCSFAHHDFYKRLATLEAFTAQTSARHKLLKKLQFLRVMMGKIKRLYHFLKIQPSLSNWLDEATQLLQQDEFPSVFMDTFMAELEVHFTMLKREAEHVERMVWW